MRKLHTSNLISSRSLFKKKKKKKKKGHQSVTWVHSSLISFCPWEVHTQCYPAGRLFDAIFIQGFLILSFFLFSVWHLIRSSEWSSSGGAQQQQQQQQQLSTSAGNWAGTSGGNSSSSSTFGSSLQSDFTKNSSSNAALFQQRTGANTNMATRWVLSHMFSIHSFIHIWTAAAPGFSPLSWSADVPKERGAKKKGSAGSCLPLPIGSWHWAVVRVASCCLSLSTFLCVFSSLVTSKEVIIWVHRRLESLHPIRLWVSSSNNKWVTATISTVTIR